jgi:hypothetical protein
MSGSGRISVDSVVSLSTQSASQGCLIDVPLVLLPMTGDGSELLYFPLVAPVAELLLHGQWSSVVGLGRWSALDLPADFRERIRPCGHEKAEQVELTPDRASFLADQVREWATTLLGQAADVDVDAMKLSVEGAVRWLDGLSDSLRAPPEAAMAIKRGTQHYSAMQLVHTLLLSGSLKDTQSLKQVVRRAFQLAFPSLATYAQDIFRQHSDSSLPSASTVSRARLLLDASLLLVQNNDNTPRLRYGIADSSPQKGHDWLLSAVDEVLANDAVPCFEAFKKLVADAARRAAGQAVEEETGAANHKIVFKAIRRVTNIPVALGQGATTLTHKVAALMYMWCCGRKREDLRESLSEHLCSYVSFCADMGVELGVAEYVVGDPLGLLPAWFQLDGVGMDVECAAENDGHADFCLQVPAPVECDVMEESEPEPAAAGTIGAATAGPLLTNAVVAADFDGGYEPAVEPVLDASAHLAAALAYAKDKQATSLMPLALTLPAVLHIVHNLLREVDTSLEGWGEFWRKLKILESLFKFGRKDRFVKFCVMDSPVHAQAPHFEAASVGHLYEDRFGEVANFCKQVGRWSSLLRVAWDAGKYEKGPGVVNKASSKDAEFDPKQLTAVMKDDGFWGYVQMVTEVHSIAQQVADWAEGCECHQDLLDSVASPAARYSCTIACRWTLGSRWVVVGLSLLSLCCR